MASLHERKVERASVGSVHQQKAAFKRPPSRPAKGKKKTRPFLSLNWLALFSLALLSSVALFFWMRLQMSSSSLPSHITPFPGPKVSDLPQFKGKHQEDLFWGTYRPHVYLGIRARRPKSLLAGLMWIGVNNNGLPAIRHTCEASDNLKRYGWLRHDGKCFGYQEIVDGNIVIKNTFVKEKFNSSGYGGDWAVRVSAEQISEESSKGFPIFFYVADEAGNPLNIRVMESTLGSEISLVSGWRKDVGHWNLHVSGVATEEVHHAGFATAHMHNLTNLVSQMLELQVRRMGILQLPDQVQGSSNLAIFQFNCKMPCTFDIIYTSGAISGSTEAQVKHLAGSDLSNEIHKRERDFEKKFEQTFHLKAKGLDERHMEVGRAALSNLLGGIGYFFGQSLIAIPAHLQIGSIEKHWLYWPSSLYTAVPSRSMFPRGFLWDEGFHQLLLRRWDKKMSMEIIGNWLDLLNVNGWIPREQILGMEARSKVPEEFVLQHTDNANPPTLFLSLQDFLPAVSEESPSSLSVEDREFLERSFPRLQAWFNWLNTSQIGEVPGSYYWHGRIRDSNRELNPKTLSSGFDDYPRASHPSPEERHLDLRCWMAMAANTMAAISSLLGKNSDGYEKTAQQLTDLDLLNKVDNEMNILLKLLDKQLRVGFSVDIYEWWKCQSASWCSPIGLLQSCLHLDSSGLTHQVEEKFCVHEEELWGHWTQNCNPENGSAYCCDLSM